MKTFKTILAAVLFLTVSNGLMAQTTDNSTIIARASVIQPIEVNSDQELLFGTVIAGITKTIDLNGDAVEGGITSISGAVETQAGRFIVSAAATSGVALNFTFPSNLENSGELLPIKDFVTGFVNDAQEVVEFAAPGTHSFTSFPQNNVADDNAIYVLVGATVDPDANQAPGNYSGTIILTAEYN